MYHRFIIILFALFLISGTLFADEADFVMINHLKYYKDFTGISPETYIKIPFGDQPDMLAGPEEDTEQLTEGVPFAFRITESGAVWILDSANKAVKLFNQDASIEKVVDISSLGTLVRDFYPLPEGGFWFLNSVEGNLYRTDNDGGLLSQIEGFEGARAIEVNYMGELLVKHAPMQAILKFDSSDTLKQYYIADQSLSLFTNKDDSFYGISIEKNVATLYLRTSPSDNLVLTKIEIDTTHENITYAAAQILGVDSANNLYFWLVACDENGNIFYERYYKATEKGEILSFINVFSIPYTASDLPRYAIVTTDGRVMTFYEEDNHYVLCIYGF